MHIPYWGSGVLGAIGLAPQYCGDSTLNGPTVIREKEFQRSMRLAWAGRIWPLTANGRTKRGDVEFPTAMAAKMTKVAKLPWASRRGTRRDAKTQAANAPIDPQSVTEGLNLNFGISATDPDATTPSLIAEDVPANATFSDNGDGTGTFDFNPNYVQAGLYNVRFIASDGALADTEVVAITVNEAGNQTPIMDPIGNRAVTEGNTLAFRVYAFDPDLDPVSWATTLLPPNATY